MSIEAKLAARDTPAGRRYEANIVYYDCLILIVGCIGLAVNFPPVVYFAAAGTSLPTFSWPPPNGSGHS